MKKRIIGIISAVLFLSILTSCGTSATDQNAKTTTGKENSISAEKENKITISDAFAEEISFKYVNGYGDVSADEDILSVVANKLANQYLADKDMNNAEIEDFLQDFTSDLIYDVHMVCEPTEMLSNGDEVNIAISTTEEFEEKYGWGASDTDITVSGLVDKDNAEKFNLFDSKYIQTYDAGTWNFAKHYGLLNSKYEHIHFVLTEDYTKFNEGDKITITGIEIRDDDSAFYMSTKESDIYNYFYQEYKMLPESLTGEVVITNDMLRN